MKPEEIEALKERLRESAGAFRNHNLYDSEGDAFRLVEQADECDQAASTIEALQAENERLREALTPSAHTKAAYIGEFSFPFPVFDEDGEEVMMSLTVPWTTTKEIMAVILKRADSSQ